MSLHAKCSKGTQLKGQMLCGVRGGATSLLSHIPLLFNEQTSQVPLSIISDCLGHGLLDWKDVEAVKYVKQYVDRVLFCPLYTSKWLNNISIRMKQKGLDALQRLMRRGGQACKRYGRWRRR